MATITGSSTIDWSGVSLAQVDFGTDFRQILQSSRSDTYE